jgi:molecular chaperone GrpE
VSAEPVTDPPEASAADSPPTLETITADRDRLATELTGLQDRYLRAQAEFHNARRRADKEKVEFVEYASMEAVRSVLPVLDDFERALKSDSGGQEYVKGMELIHQRLVDTLKKLGLEPISSQGQPFDPNLHHAVDSVETDEAPDQTVLEEYQRGYNFKGRLLRAAMVKVAVDPQNK